jgi:hypothetical protein
MSTTAQLNKWMQHGDPNFIGTFSLNTIPYLPHHHHLYFVQKVQSGKKLRKS